MHDSKLEISQRTNERELKTYRSRRQSRKSSGINIELSIIILAPLIRAISPRTTIRIAEIIHMVARARVNKLHHHFIADPVDLAARLVLSRVFPVVSDLKAGGRVANIVGERGRAGWARERSLCAPAGVVERLAWGTRVCASASIVWAWADERCPDVAEVV